MRADIEVDEFLQARMTMDECSLELPYRGTAASWFRSGDATVAHSGGNQMADQIDRHHSGR
jgi:hypothetical protein